MRVIVDGMIRLDPRECRPRLLEALDRRLCYPNPEFTRRVRAGRSTAGVPDALSAVVTDDAGRVCLPRGVVHVLRAEARSSGVDLAFEDRRVSRARLELQSEVSLRPYQEEAVAAMCRQLQGVLVLATGGGKTTIGVASIARHGQPTLILTHTRELLAQWRETVSRMLGVEPSVATGGSVDLGPVTIATVQTLAALSPETLDGIGNTFGCVVVDECHRAPAAMFQRVLQHLPARYRFGLTATPEREDGLSPLLGWVFGEELFRLESGALFDLGVLTRPRAKVVHTSFAFTYGGPADRAPMLDALVASADRNALIARLAVDEARAGHTVLILSERVSHCRHLAALVCERGVTAEVLVGAVPPATRKAVLDEFRSGRLKVVVASTLADEGLDVPRLSRLILSFPGRARGRVVQRIGRLMRPHPDKRDAIVFDIVDPLVPPLLRAHRERRAAYASLVQSVTPFAPAARDFSDALATAPP